MRLANSDFLDYDYGKDISDINVWDKVFIEMNKKDFVQYMIQAEKVKRSNQKKIS